METLISPFLGEAESNYAEDSSDTVIMDQNDDDNTDQSFNTDSHKNESEEGNDPDSDTVIFSAFYTVPQNLFRSIGS